MDSESIGLATIAIGLIIAIGVVRGTWKKVFADVGLSNGSTTAGPTAAPAAVGAPAATVNYQAMGPSPAFIYSTN